jgi:hypothetical protein
MEEQQSEPRVTKRKKNVMEIENYNISNENVARVA